MALLGPLAYLGCRATEKFNSSTASRLECPKGKNAILQTPRSSLFHHLHNPRVDPRDLFLTPYATAFRCPGDVLEPEVEDIEEAIP